MPRPLRPLLTCVGTALALAGALALPTAAPTYEERYRPIATGGDVGQTLTNRDFRIRVRQVVLANSLVAKARTKGLASRERVIGTESVWVVVVADVATERKELDAGLLEGGEITTSDGATYRKDIGMPARGDKELDNPIPLGPPTTQRFFFQIPRDRLTGASFEVTMEDLKFADDPKPWEEQWFLPAARVDLGFDSPERTREALRHAVDRLPVPGVVY